MYGAALLQMRGHDERQQLRVATSLDNRLIGLVIDDNSDNGITCRPSTFCLDRRQNANLSLIRFAVIDRALLGSQFREAM